MTIPKEFYFRNHGVTRCHRPFISSWIRLRVLANIALSNLLTLGILHDHSQQSVARSVLKPRSDIVSPSILFPQHWVGKLVRLGTEVIPVISFVGGKTWLEHFLCEYFSEEDYVCDEEKLLRSDPIRIAVRGSHGSETANQEHWSKWSYVLWSSSPKALLFYDLVARRLCDFNPSLHCSSILVILD